ncbi:hypothetical protein Cob_v005777 [Colletotrichum orbiculare MAFF 240422]|uniref:Uncharacterized protein n=1 Tax=Colletotrichum orbiculare (strain 104-T / ATCC 96160 / CBS 514.97 / LARS 414 / MAFF 240422) TaxID=1213857 RepID=A0A484FSF2_COLOR|nr:hypothetical protein Cob_v005777 [Colletotrichum orbiculare MAFF 240422]
MGSKNRRVFGSSSSIPLTKYVQDDYMVHYTDGILFNKPTSTMLSRANEKKSPASFPNIVSSAATSAYLGYLATLLQHRERALDTYAAEKIVEEAF